MAYNKGNRPNSGVLFKEEQKKNEKGPDYRGSININGTEFRLAGWIKESQNSGKKFLSLSVDKDRNQQQDDGGF